MGNWFLVIMWCANNTALSCSVTTIPKPFSHAEHCIIAGRAIESNLISFKCVGAS